ncbi:4-carboxymuconolactone decarboxylase [[Actinomadura] parvosata subsp. kistnae]|nr:4-carboxymuconolactone decarboxylase [Actinomadura parvosata subsp. kistnae]
MSAEELKHAITHLAFYAGWPNAMTAMTQLKNIIDEGAEPGWS